MENVNDIAGRLHTDKWISNNGVLLRAINIGRTNYNKLSALRRALDREMDIGEFADGVNYLAEAGYINLRTVGSHQAASLADNDIDNLEAKLSADGIRLLAGKLSDDCVRA